MELAIDEARLGINNNDGGPFGCVIIKDGEIIAQAHNTVVRDNDPTAHGEMNAIRIAGKKLGTFDLSGCELFTTSEPCPMCLSAIIWANIKTVYYGCNCNDAASIGFRDDFIYDYIKNGGDILKLKELTRAQCVELFSEYTSTPHKLY